MKLPWQIRKKSMIAVFEYNDAIEIQPLYTDELYFISKITVKLDIEETWRVEVEAEGRDESGKFWKGGFFDLKAIRAMVVTVDFNEIDIGKELTRQWVAEAGDRLQQMMPDASKETIGTLIDDWIERMVDILITMQRGDDV